MSTSGVAAVVTAFWFAAVHWHLKSVAPQVVAEATAFAMAGWAHAGISEVHWPDTKAAAATARRTEAFMFTDRGLLVYG